MKSKFIFLIMIFFITNIFAQGASQRLTQLLSDFNSMQASFVQNSYDNRDRLLQKSTGIMALQRPGRFRWQTTSPSQQLIVADGKNIWIYDADLQQATKQAINEQSTNPASLLSGSTTSFQQRFTVNKINSQMGETFELKPIAKGDMFQWIQLHFQNNQLTDMTLSDNLGQKTTVAFSQIRTNIPLNSNLFQFNPPKGTDIFNQ